LLGIVFFSAVYFAFTRSGLALALLYQNSTPVWPATGMAIAGLARFGPRYALGITIGAFAANAFIGAESLYLLGAEKKGAPVRQALRRVGDLIRMAERGQAEG